jgi:hypothetical protein
MGWSQAHQGPWTKNYSTYYFFFFCFVFVSLFFWINLILVSIDVISFL